MKNLLLLIILIVSFGATAQLSGELVTSGRKCLTETDFTVKGTQAGVLKYQLSVDNTGRVVAETLLREESTVRSTPSIIKARNYIKTLKFEPGTAYPQYHQVKILIHIER